MERDECLKFWIKYNPVGYIPITEHEINLLIKNIEPSWLLCWGSEWHLIYIGFYNKVEHTLAYEFDLLNQVEIQSLWIEAPPRIFNQFFSDILRFTQVWIIIALPGVIA